MSRETQDSPADGCYARPVDELRRAIKTDFSLRVIAAVTTGLVGEASARHGLRGVEVVALGRALTAACLLTTLSKHASERLRLEIRSSGPLRGLLVDAHGDGSVRGCLQRHLSADEHERLSPTTVFRGAAGPIPVAAAVGHHGTVVVTRDLGLDQRYQGSVEVTTGEVDQDLEHYLNTSEQLPSALACEVVLDHKGQVQRAAGLLCQTFPGGDTTELDQLRARLAAGNLADLLRHERSCDELIGFALGGEPHDDMGAEPLQFRCNCGPERARQVVSTLGAEDIEALADEQAQTEVRCEYCSVVYQLSSDELRALAAEIRRGRS
jgi:molecular chaperone Hsp33